MISVCVWAYKNDIKKLSGTVNAWVDITGLCLCEIIVMPIKDGLSCSYFAFEFLTFGLQGFKISTIRQVLFQKIIDNLSD